MNDAVSHDPSRAALNLDDAELDALRKRLRRAQGQIGGIITMLEQGRDCRAIVQQLAAVNSALDKTGFIMLEKALRQCVTNPDHSTDDIKTLEQLFLSLS